MKFSSVSLAFALAFSPTSDAFQQGGSAISAKTGTTELNLFRKEDPTGTFVIKKPSKKQFGFFPSSTLKVPVMDAAKDLKKVEQDEDDGSWTDFGKDPITYAYGGAWAALLTFTFVIAPGELGSAADSAMIQSIIDNPAAPDMNPFYYGIFNLFALIPVVLACTIAPRASAKGIPAGPPLFLSTFIAYFIMGPYLALRKAPKQDIASSDELGWATRNIWENKLVNYGTVAFGLLCLASGAPGLEDPSANLQGMLDLIGSSRFASVSFADLSLITLILTKEVADDYKIRCDPANADKATLVGASTALLPILGAAIYCAARPSLLQKEES